MKKKAIELSINFLVMFVLAVVVFSFGVRFIYQLYEEAEEIKRVTIDELDDSIGDILCSSSQRVCIGQDKYLVPRGEFIIFAVNVINVLDRDIFLIDVRPSDPIGYTADNDPIYDIDNSKQIEVKYRSELVVEKFEKEGFGVGIQVPKSGVRSGTYIFDVILSRQSTGEQYTNVQKLYVEVP